MPCGIKLCLSSNLMPVGLTFLICFLAFEYFQHFKLFEPLEFFDPYKKSDFQNSWLFKLFNLPTVQPHWVHFPRAITRAWVGLLGRLWYILVEEGLTFFLRYHGPIYVDGKVFKNQVKNWKIAFLAFFVHLVKCPNHHNKVPFFLLFPPHGDERDWYRHNWVPWVGYLGY